MWDHDMAPWVARMTETPIALDEQKKTKRPDVDQYMLRLYAP